MPKNEGDETFLIVGLGPCGGILGAHLASGGHHVSAVDVWDEHREAIASHGMKVRGFRTLNEKLSRVSSSLADFNGEKFDYIVIAVKTPFLPGVVEQILAVGGDPMIVAFQNGIDNEDYLARYIKRNRILRVAINYAGMVIEPGLIEMTFFHHPNQIGCICGKKGLCPHSTTIAGIMTTAGLETEAVPDIKTYTWRKTILNSALSAVSAVLGMTMKEVMTCTDSFHLVELMLRECIEVARARGLEFGPGFYDHCLDYLSKAGHHKPSMLVDLERGQQTEIDYINGKIDSYGFNLNIPVPVNSTLTALVKAREYKLGATKCRQPDTNGQKASERLTTG